MAQGLQGRGCLRGKSVWCSKPSSSLWNEALMAKMGWPCWMAVTRRVENERPSRTRSTRYTRGADTSAGANEIGLEAVDRAIFHRAGGRYQGLARHLAPKHPLAILLGADSPEDVLLNGLQIQQFDERIYLGLHDRLILPFAPRIPCCPTAGSLLLCSRCGRIGGVLGYAYCSPCRFLSRPALTSWTTGAACCAIAAHPQLGWCWARPFCGCATTCWAGRGWCPTWWRL